MLRPPDMMGKKIQKFVAMLLLLGLFIAYPSTAPALTLEEERKLGRETYEKLAKGNVLLQSEWMVEYINRIGNRILANSDKLPFEYHFSVIQSNAINAFATPGGYVYVNRGLITLAENESELAGVMAHEIAHVNARHIADTIEKSSRVNMATLAGMLAGILVGGGGNLTAGLLGMSTAAGATMSLKYSREHEEEADRMGMLYLVRSGYDPKSMLDFLKIMRRYEFYSSNVPSYFLTHPGTDERIRYLDGTIQTTYTQGGDKSIIGGFKRIQTILRIIDAQKQEANRKYFEEGVKKNPHDVDDLYGLAVTESKSGQTDLALKHFHQALALAPEDRDILGDTGITYFMAGRIDEALHYLKEAIRLKSRDPEAWLYLGKAYEAKGDLTNAIATLKVLEKKKSDDDEFYYNLAMIYGKANNKMESHFYFGTYFKKKKKIESALFHFKAALEKAPPGSVRAGDIQREISALQRRGSQPQEAMKGRRR